MKKRMGKDTKALMVSILHNKCGLDFAVLECIHAGHDFYKTTNDTLDTRPSLQLFRRRDILLLAGLPFSTTFMIAM